MNAQSERSQRQTGAEAPTPRDGARRPELKREVQQAVDEVSEAIRSGTEASATVTEDIATAAREAVGTAAKAVASQASEAVGSVAAQLGSSMNEQKSRGADSLVGLAHAIKTAAAELDEQSPTIARQFRGASERIERLSGSLRDRRVEDLITDYSNLAKTQPAAFFAGAMIAGFALSRFIKSSSTGGAEASSSPQTGSDAGA